MQKYTDEDLRNLIKKLGDEVGRTPTIKDLKGADGYPPPSTFERRFGSWNKTIAAAGFIIERSSKKEERKTDEQLLDELIAKAEELNRSPTSREMDKDPEVSGSSVYKKHFGSWNNALESAGLFTNY